MNWAYGITTIPERVGTLLPQTIESLAAAGFDRPVLFVDGHIPGYEALEVVCHPRVGQLRNWMHALFYLFTTKDADRYAIFEDDVLACRQLREYMERCPLGKVYWNLLTLDENRMFTGDKPGWHESNQLGRSACGLVFDRPTVDCLLRMERFVRGPGSGETMSDAVVIATLKSLGYKELVHYPSLLQHVGLESTLGNSFGNVSAFLGEEYDLLSLPAPKQAAPRKSSRCQFARDGEFMVCQICGWRMRIADPSLPPEKYHARCGGAEARAQNERKPAQSSTSKRSPSSKRPAKKCRTFQLGTIVSRCLKRIGIRQKVGCGCQRREETLNRWGRRFLRVFLRR
ncbi:MAG: hypothetical protein L0228_21050 [Planctomycetes bacterium]|nr:hypothetical protein [Planctomycetota bacterium]